MMRLTQRLDSIWGWIVESAPDFRDLHVYGGGVLIAAGAFLIYRPVGLMVFGAVLLFLGLKRPV